MAADEETIYGLHPVLEALAAGEPIRRVFVGGQRRNDAEVKPLLAQAQRRSIPVSYDDGRVFAALKGRNHQHVAAMVEPFHYHPWAQLREDLRGAEKAIVLVLDHLEDPHNVGAVLRNAEGAGTAAVLLPDRRAAHVTAVVRRVAAGAASHLKIARVPNIATSLEALKSDGFWIAGLSLAPSAQPYWQARYAEKTALVLGAEGKGLARLVADRCDFLVKIPLWGQVASLNAASAAAVVLFEVARQLYDAGYRRTTV